MAKRSTRSAALVLRIRPELKTALERLAGSEHRTVSNYVELILERHVAISGRKRAPGSH
jgi:hypothetical protein